MINNLLQVVWLNTPTLRTSWEPASALPDRLVQDYEEGQSADILESASSGGQTIHTVSTIAQPDIGPKSKRKCSDSSCADKDKGNVR